MVNDYCCSDPLRIDSFEHIPSSMPFKENFLFDQPETFSAAMAMG